MTAVNSTDAGEPVVRPFEDLRFTGLLALINVTVFHPRGYGLTLVYDDDSNPIGWTLQGDGREPWTFGDDWQQDFVRYQSFLTGDHGTFASSRSEEK